MKKILYLITQSEWGGAQEYIFDLACNLDKSQYHSLVLAGQGNGDLFKALEAKNIPSRRLKYAKRSINPLFDLMVLFELISLFKKENPDVIHLNSSKIGFLGSLAAKLCGSRAKVIYTAHGWVFNEPLPYLIKKLYYCLEKFSAPLKNVIICVAEADRQIALNHNFKTNLVTIHNAVNNRPDYFLSQAEARAFFNLTESDLIVGTIANFYKTKGLNFLIEAASLLKKDFPAIKTVIIGEGEERTRLETMIKNLGLQDNIILTGAITDAHKYLKAFDLFVLPSVKEGLPYAVLHALAAQIPIVATRVGGLPEILPAEMLVEPGNAGLLAEKIKIALAGRLPIFATNPDSFQQFLQKTIALY